MNIALNHPEKEEREHFAARVARRAPKPLRTVTLPPSHRSKGQPRVLPVYPANESFRQRFLAERTLNPNWSNEFLATQVGMSDGVLGQYFSAHGNLYSGDTKGIEEALAEFLRDYRLNLDTGVETIACDISRQIERAVEEACESKKLTAIIGEPGIGKSRGISLVKKQRTLAIEFRVCEWQKNPSAAAQCLFAAANVAHPRRGLTGMETLVEKMTGSNRPILIDDAHKLTRGALQLFCDFRDCTEMPLILFGDRRLVAKLKDDGQRLRRVGRVVRLAVKDPLPLIEHHLNIFAPDANGYRRELIRLARFIVDMPGHFGSLQSQLALAARLRKKEPTIPWDKALRGANALHITLQALS